ncbi:MAG: hypothetical protein IJW13_03195, partial [Clostridia bacterium]|nr:hypothetical protein [Clostridia bacterium]
MANKSNSKKNNVFFTAEVFGMALALFSLLALLCLISGDSIFYDLGPTVQRFLLGVFGYLSFPVLLVTTFMGVKLLIGFRVENKTFKKACIYFALYLLFAGLIFQTAKTTVSGTYGDYITACYNGGLSLSSSTAGGVLLALINYPVVNYLSPVGGYVIYSFALAATTVVLLRKRIAIALSEREPRKTNQPSKKNNGDKADSAATDGDDFVNDDENDEQPEYAPPKKIIFGGGAFELKTDKEKKNTQNESGAGLKVLFDESDGLGVPSGRGSYSANPIEPERSYRESYDRDMQDKTDFVRRPYTARSTAPISNPMGSMSSTSASSYSTESGRDMDIDLSEPERDTYVINNGGYERRGIDSFRERSSEFTPSNYEGEGRADSAFDRSRSEDRFSAYSERPAYDRSDREGNSDSSFGRYGDFGERSGFSGSSRGVEEDRSSGYGEQSYARKPFTPFDGTQTRRSEESYTDGARTGSYSRMGERTPERMPERAPESTRSGYDEGAPSPSDRVRSFRPTESNERLGSYSTDGVSAEGYGERGDRRMDSGHRQTPFERARMAQQSRAEARAQEQQSPAQPEYTVPSSNEGYDEYDSGEVYGEQAIGSYFDASEPSKRKPRASISRDMSHKGETPNSTVVTSGSSLGTTKPAPLATGTSKSEANGSTSGTQLSIDSLPEKNRLENPIDNIPKSYKYVFPPIDLLNEYKPNANDERNNLEEQSQRKETILQVLSTVNIDAKIEDVKVGPAITRFELSIPPTISIKKVTEKQDDLTLWLKSKNKIRIVAPIAGTSRIGIEVSNSF